MPRQKLGCGKPAGSIETTFHVGELSSQRVSLSETGMFQAHSAVLFDHHRRGVESQTAFQQPNLPAEAPGQHRLPFGSPEQFWNAPP